MEHLDSVYFFFISLFSSILLTVFFSSEETKKKKASWFLRVGRGYGIYCTVMLLLSSYFVSIEEDWKGFCPR